MAYLKSAKRQATRRKFPLAFESLENRALMAGDFTQPTVNTTAEEQYMLELINRGRANPTAEAQRYGVALNDGLDPGEITTIAKQPLAPVPALLLSSERHSRDMIARDYFAHNAPAPAPNGITPSDRARNAGYGAGIGENAAYLSISGRDTATLIQETHAMLVRSAGHRRNLLRDRYNDIGIGVERGDFNLPPVYAVMMTTENFGTNPVDQFSITGVVYTDKARDDNFYTIGEGANGVTIVATASDGTTYRTKTGVSGGYALRVPDGTYEVSAILASGERRAIRNVTIQTVNVKVDVDLSVIPPPDPRLDTNRDGVVSSLDVLAVFNHINASRRGLNPGYSAQLDTNNDRAISSLDVLAVFNYMNFKSRANPEGDGTVTTSADNVLATDEPLDEGVPLDFIDDLQRARKRQ